MYAQRTIKHVIQLWDDYYPVLEITRKTGVKRGDIKKILGERYTKNEAHYRATKWRDNEKMQVLVDWYNTSFNKQQLQSYIDQGQLQKYFLLVYHQTKVSIPTIRNYITKQLGGKLPNKSKSDQYQITGASKYRGRESEIIAMWNEQMSIAEIREKTGVNTNTIAKVLRTQGIDTSHGHYHRTREAMADLRAKNDQEAIMRIKNSKLNDQIIKDAIKNGEYSLLIENTAKTIGVGKNKLDRLVKQLFSTSTNLLKPLEDRLLINEQDLSYLNHTTVAERNEWYTKRAIVENTTPVVLRRAAIHKYPQLRMFKQEVPHDYIGQIPEWAWQLIEKQPFLLLIDKVQAIFKNKKSILTFLHAAEVNVGRKISRDEIEVYLPKINAVSAWQKDIRRRFPNDSDIEQAFSSKSSYENQMDDFLKTIDDDFEVNNRHTLNNKTELDFYYPKKHLAIELSPLATHSSANYPQNGLLMPAVKKPNYHVKKYQACENQKIQLITLFEKELHEPLWSKFTKPLIKMKVLGHAEKTYYARQTKIKVINKSQARKFLNKWHMDGYVPCRYAYGIYDMNNELLGVATFGLPQLAKYKSQKLLELKRLAWRSNVQVRYGISKIISKVANDYGEQYNGVLTFSNNNMGNGLGYAKAGFTFIKNTGPQLHFINPQNANDQYSWSVATPWSAQSGVLAKALGSKKLTNAEARVLVETELPHRFDDGKGYAPQYDCGNKVWVKWF